MMEYTRDKAIINIFKIHFLRSENSNEKNFIPHFSHIFGPTSHVELLLSICTNVHRRALNFTERF